MFNRRERKYDGNFHCFSAWVTRPRPGTLWLREAAQTYSFNIIPAADRDYLPPQLLPFQFPRILRPVGGWCRGLWPRVHVCSVMRKRGITVRWDQRPAGMDTHFQEAYFSIFWQVLKFVFINICISKPDLIDLKPVEPHSYFPGKMLLSIFSRFHPWTRDRAEWEREGAPGVRGPGDRCRPWPGPRPRQLSGLWFSVSVKCQVCSVNNHGE